MKRAWKYLMLVADGLLNKPVLIPVVALELALLGLLLGFLTHAVAYPQG